MSAYTDAIDRNLKGLENVNAGIARQVCPTCDNAHDGVSDENLEAIGDEGGFSCESCDCCGSHYHGNRFAAHAHSPKYGWIHLEICEDCLMFIANGDEPETWRDS